MFFRFHFLIFLKAKSRIARGNPHRRNLHNPGCAGDLPLLANPFMGHALLLVGSREGPLVGTAYTFVFASGFPMLRFSEGFCWGVSSMPAVLSE